MSCLYDIHTHHTALGKMDGYEIKSLVNVYPFDFGVARAENPDLYFSCGVHPWYSTNSESQLSDLDEIVKDAAVVAIGETGLDKLKGVSLEVQESIFRHHILLSEKYQKPLIVHCVKAWDQLIAIYKATKPQMPWVIHGYRGNPQQAQQLISLGIRFSIGEKYNEDVVRLIPSSSLFCETDMSSNSISQIYDRVAGTRDISKQELISLIENNVKKTFCKW